MKIEDGTEQWEAQGVMGAEKREALWTANRTGTSVLCYMSTFHEIGDYFHEEDF